MARLNTIAGSLGKALLVGVLSSLVFLAALMIMSVPERRLPQGGARSDPYAALFAGVPEDTTLGSSIYDAGSPAVPILCYHYFRADTTPLQFVKILGALFLNLPLLDDMDVWTQSSSSFEGQLAYLKSEGYESVGLEDLVLWQRGIKELPEKPVVITIDDGDRSILDYAYPALKRYGFKATLFVVTSQVGHRWERVDCLSWEELKRLSDSGVFSIQSHSHDLHRKVNTPRGRLPVFVAASLGVCDVGVYGSWTEFVYGDLKTSRDLIRENIGGDARFLAWPYGFADAKLDSLAALAGFTSTCTLRVGTNRRFRPAGGLDGGGLVTRSYAAWPLHDLKRLTVTARTSMNGFRRILVEHRTEPPLGETVSRR